MINQECQECIFFNNTCFPFEQISEKYNCNYLSNFDINGEDGELGEEWSNISYRRYVQTSLDI